MKSKDIVWHGASVRRENRQLQNGHGSAVVWFTGLSGAGKSTLAYALEERLHDMGCRTYVLDGDNVRHGLCSDLGFSSSDRTENIRRVGEVARLMADAGLIVLAAFISPFRSDRDRIRALMPAGEFIEVFCRCDLTVFEARDVKGLYQRARLGGIQDFTGITSPYEPPLDPELVLETGRLSLESCVSTVLDDLAFRGFISPSLKRCR